MRGPRAPRGEAWGGPPRRGRHDHDHGPEGGRFGRDHDHDHEPDHRDRHDGPSFGHHRRTRRGEIRAGLLSILAEGPGHGYELIQRIEAKTGGAWKPSPGSIYPNLQLLQDEGFVTVTERDGKRIFELTDEGRSDATRRAEEAGGDPFARIGGRGQAKALFEAVGSVAIAAKQVAMGGQSAQIEAAAAIMKDARKKLYQLLAADDE